MQPGSLLFETKSLLIYWSRNSLLGAFGRSTGLRVALLSLGNQGWRAHGESCATDATSHAACLFRSACLAGASGAPVLSTLANPGPYHPGPFPSLAICAGGPFSVVGQLQESQPGGGPVTLGFQDPGIWPPPGAQDLGQEKESKRGSKERRREGDRSDATPRGASRARGP